MFPFFNGGGAHRTFHRNQVAAGTPVLSLRVLVAELLRLHHSGDW